MAWGMGLGWCLCEHPQVTQATLQHPCRRLYRHTGRCKL